MLVNPIVTQLYDGKIPIYMIWLVVKKTILKNQVNGKDDIPYMKWKITNVPNHQPDKIGIDICN